MNKTTVMRSLRISHKISLQELADAAGVSNQYISRIDLGSEHGKKPEQLVQQAFEKIISQQTDRLEKLKEAYFDSKDRLLEFEIWEDIV